MRDFMDELQIVRLDYATVNLHEISRRGFILQCLSKQTSDYHIYHQVL